MVLENIYLFLPFLCLQVIPILIISLSHKRLKTALVIAGLISVSLMGLPAVLHVSARRIGCAFGSSELKSCDLSPIREGLVAVAPEASMALLVILILYWARRSRLKVQMIKASKSFG